MNAELNILKYWRDIEIFSLPDLPADLPVLDLSSPLPWTIYRAPLEDAKRRYILYFGKQQKTEVVSIIEKYTGDTEEKPDWVEKVTGNTCMAVLILEENGTLSEEGAYVQASYLHGIKSLADKTPIDDIPGKLDKLQQEFMERQTERFYSPDEHTSKKESPINNGHLRKEIAALNSIGVSAISCDERIYCQEIIISKKVRIADTSFLNSFYLEDLNHLIKKDTHWNSGLKKYLDKNTPENRIDELKSAEDFFSTIDPNKMPLGRWPSNPAYGAYAAQLGAMNTALEDLKTGGIMGINGPPGTGKTTLLSDIVAEVIVQRARKLIASNNILMFMPGEKIQRESDFLTHFPIKDPIFEDAGIVVASNNNAAVENISKELPDREKIYPGFSGAAYFNDHTRSLIEKDSWGLLAVALGNSENRRQFKSNIWYNSADQKKFSHYLGALYNNPEEIDYTTGYRTKFNTCKTDLNTLIEEFEQFRKLAHSFHALLPRQLQDLENKITLENRASVLNSEAKKFLNKISEKEILLNEYTAELKEIKELISLHQLGKPSLFFFHRLFNTKSYKGWNEPLQQYLANLNQVNIQQKEVKAAHQELKNELKKIKAEQEKLSTELSIIQGRLNEYQKQKKELHQTYGIAYGNLPDENLYQSFHNDKEQFHKSNPWSSEKINTLRSEIFLKSLHLHELAIHCNAKQFRNNINILLEMLDGKAGVSEKIATSVWKSFFFLIPVVSTSLASVSRLFKNIGKDTIGWLMLDEAGQATVQSAAGIISRSKRSIIIGDPLQIEPVMTTPGKLIEILNRPYKNEHIWSPKISSAQQLADRITEKGTEMKPGDEEKIWTGFPLRTHRRCANPMFSISNYIAYNNQMVKATPEIDEDSPLGPSCWFDVQGKMVENKQVIAEEIELLKEKLAMLKREKEIFVISPFKSVADKCRTELQRNYPAVRCGTIHTFQGKETDIVFLILGSDPKSQGARNWASSKPNMLNVALTRAKKYIYIIGNRTLWQNCQNFDFLSSELP